MNWLIYWLAFFIGTTVGLVFFTIMAALGGHTKKDIKIIEYWKQNTAFSKKKLQILQEISNSLKRTLM